MSNLAKPLYPIAIVAAGNITGPGHYESEAETLTAVLERVEQVLSPSVGKHRKFDVHVFKTDEKALKFLTEQQPHPNYRGTLLFLSGSKVGIANKIAATNEDIHVVVLSGMTPPKRQAVVINKLWVHNDSLPHMVMPG